MNKVEVKNFLLSRNIKCTDSQLDKIENFVFKTLETNKLFNLTAIKDIETFWEKMVLDSAIANYGIDLSDKSFIDVGTGGGFPGYVLYFLNPSCHATLLDSTAKKINYLKGYAEENNYKNIDFICDRAEIFARKNREKYDYAFARAVSDLSILIELMMPMIKVNGELIALKGQGVFEEINKSLPLMKKIGCHLSHIYEDRLPESDELRFIVHIKKDKITANKYPRDYSKIINKK